MNPQSDSDFYRSILDNLYDGVYFVDRERRITYWSRGAERIAGHAAEEVVGFACAEGILVHVDERGSNLCVCGCPLAATMADAEPREAAVYLHHKEGHRVPVLVRSAPLRGPGGDIEGAVEIFSDNTDAFAATQRLKEVSRELVEDPLTGVGNLRFLDMKLRSCRFESEITGRPFGVLPADVDRFKNINDSFGHAVGDRALRMTAETLRNGMRQSDYLGRWGDDEFLVILTGLSEGTLAEVGEKARVLVERSTLEADGRAVAVTVSVGATMSRLDETHEELLERVDGPLYQAKDRGRNAVYLAV